MWIRSKSMKRLYYAISKHSKAGVPILLSDKNRLQRQRVLPEIKRNTS